MPKILGLGLLITFFLSVSQIFASELTEALQERYKSIKSFQAEFSQEITNAASNMTEKRAGRISFKHPRFIKWVTEKPEKELLMVNSESVWEYFPEEKVAYRYSLSQVFQSKTMLRFITGEVNLEQEFHIQKLAKQETGWIKLELTPKNPEPSLVKAYVWIDPEKRLLRRIKLIDFFGNENLLTFTNIELNPCLEDSLFAFSPPENVQIINNE